MVSSQDPTSRRVHLPRKCGLGDDVWDALTVREHDSDEMQTRFKELQEGL